MNRKLNKLIVDYDEGQGWHDPRVVPYGPLQIDPAAKVLHYGEEIFEGLKAYPLLIPCSGPRIHSGAALAAPRLWIQGL